MCNLNFDIRLSKSQQEVYDLVHNNQYKFITVVFSRQSGKTVLMLVLCIEWLLKSKCSIAYVCRNFTLAKKLYRDLIRLLPKEIVASSNGSDFFIETTNGSTLNFYSSEQGNSLRGQTFNYMICDEFAFFKMEQTDGTHLWNDILSPTLKANGRKCIFVSTPLGKNNPLYDMYKRGLSDEFPNYASVLKTIYDDGFVSESEIEEIKRSIPELSFKQEYLCEWLEDGNTFFVGYADCFKKFIYQPIPEWIGIDLSGNGQDETIVTKINKVNQVQQYKIEGTLDMKYQKIAKIINESNNLVGAYLENNGLGTPMILEIKKLVNNKSKIHEWTTTNSSKEEIISDLAVKIANKEITFSEDEKELYDQLGDFIVTISKTRKLTFAARGNSHDDRIMSLAIALRCKSDYKFTSNSNNFFIPDMAIRIK